MSMTKKLLSRIAHGTSIMFVFGAMILSQRSVAVDPIPGKYVFVENTDRWVSIVRGEWFLIGKLDKSGDFIHEFKFKTSDSTSAGIPVATSLNSTGPNSKKVFEFRSGMLIPGEIRKEGNFVPEAGGKMIEFKDYKYSPSEIPIWNLPGRFVKK